MSRSLLACLLALAAAGSLRAQDEPVPFPERLPLKVNSPSVPPLRSTPLPLSNPAPLPTPPAMTAPAMTTPMDDPVPFGFSAAESFDHYRVWAGADFSQWWFRKAPLAVPLAITTSTPPGAGANIVGIDPNVRAALGPDPFQQDARNGGRAWLGFWFDDARSLGAEVAGLWIDSPNDRATVASNGALIISRPIFLPNGAAGVYDISYPASVAGSFTAQSHQQMQGLEANLVGFAAGNHRFAFDILAGARYLNLEDQLDLRYQVTMLTPMPAFNGLLPTGTRVLAVDTFRTTNQFYGGQLGGRFESNFGRLSLSLTAKIALGVNDMALDIAGVTNRSDISTTYAAGILANTSNVGRFRETHYAFVPEGNLAVGWWLTPNVRVKVGYNFLYISDVIRPGSHVTNNVNPASVPLDQLYGAGPVTRTSPRFQHTDFWAEGISLGIDIRY